MKPTYKAINLVVIAFTLSPVVYFLLSWSSIPETIKTTFDFGEPVVQEQSKQTLLLATIVLSVTAAGVYLLMRNLKKFDPKVKKDLTTSGFNRMGLSIAIFLVLLNYFLILTAVHSWEVSEKVIYIFFGLLVAVLGNYLYNIKPNFFAGIRLPWTLNDIDNWRQTHHLAGKLWFVAGIILSLISGFLSEMALKPVFISTIILIVLIPCIYSYRLFRTKK